MRLRGLRPICLLAILVPAIAAQPKYDLLLKGGHVIDAKNHIDGVRDVAIANGRIAQVAEKIDSAEAKKVVNVSGLYVTPGLLDIHVHVFRRSNPPPNDHDESVQPDAFSFRSGVTTMVDAGGSGWKDFPDFRDHVIKRAKTRVLAFLNIVGAGMHTGHESEVSEMDPEAAAKCAKENPDFIVGFKSAHYTGPDWASVENAVKAGVLSGLPVMVDFGNINELRSINKLFLEKLRPGDIFTHCFSGHREEVLENGRLNPAMIAGRKRGIIFDIGFGTASFYWYVAVPAYEVGFYPDSVSTDLHSVSMNGPMKNLDNVMTDLLGLGSSIEDVVRMATWAPAQEIRRKQLGNLDPGTTADVAVLRVEKGQFGLLDSAGAKKEGTQRIVCELTLREGQVAWDLNGLASEDWKTFRYKKGPFIHK
ncbi:MAG TPA: amidohydrolase/deacetylase family metallohydrolase [Bryobacteraceae bacterium]|nr:amidohydrolase/deacetylase family metallohydrolase [Bryobacteraceae bacterium]